MLEYEGENVFSFNCCLSQAARTQGKFSLHVLDPDPCLRVVSWDRANRTQWVIEHRRQPGYKNSLLLSLNQEKRHDIRSISSAAFGSIWRIKSYHNLHLKSGFAPLKVHWYQTVAQGLAGADMMSLKWIQVMWLHQCNDVICWIFLKLYSWPFLEYHFTVRKSFRTVGWDSSTPHASFRGPWRHCGDVWHSNPQSFIISASQFFKIKKKTHHILHANALRWSLPWKTKNRSVVPEYMIEQKHFSPLRHS